MTRYGDDSLSFFKLRKDLHYLFSADRRAFLGYRVRGGVLVVSGDPVGPPDAIPELVRDLFAFARDHGLRVAAVGASAAMADIYREAGMRAIYIGDEAIVDTKRFSLDGRPIRKVRQSVARIERAGYQLRVARLGDMSGVRARRTGARLRALARRRPRARLLDERRRARRLRAGRQPGRSSPATPTAARAGSCTWSRARGGRRCRCR